MYHSSIATMYSKAWLQQQPANPQPTLRNSNNEMHQMQKIHTLLCESLRSAPFAGPKRSTNLLSQQ
eukprot:scaffold2429_cov149-Skeletonema_menzelii.AAC.17